MAIDSPCHPHLRRIGRRFGPRNVEDRGRELKFAASESANGFNGNGSEEFLLMFVAELRIHSVKNLKHFFLAPLGMSGNFLLNRDYLRTKKTASRREISNRVLPPESDLNAQKPGRAIGV